MTEMNKPIRILHVVTYMGRGGLETMLMNYYRNIDRDKVQFDFLTHRDFEADYDKEIKELGGNIYQLPRLNPFSPAYLRLLDQFFREHKEYRIVHSHLDCMAGIPLKYAKKNGVPVRIAHAHSSNQVKDKKYVLKLYFKRNITKYATNLFACSRDAGKWMFNTDDFKIVNNAIDAKKYIYNENIRKTLRNNLQIDSDTFVIGHVGSFSNPKNHLFLVDVFENIVKRHQNSKLLLVGDGELKDVVYKKCQLNALEDKVIFTGIRDDVPDLLQVMDAFVFPSLFEGLGIAVVEAQAAGLPCLISDRVPIECEKTEGLVYQLKLDSGPESWAEMALQCAEIERRNTIKQIEKADFDIHKNADRLQQFYLKVLDGEK